MKKLQTSDLTPALLTEVKKFSEPQEVVAFFKEKDFEVSETAAKKILDYVKDETRELSADDLAKVSGGCGGVSANTDT